MWVVVVVGCMECRVCVSVDVKKEIGRGGEGRRGAVLCGAKGIDSRKEGGAGGSGTRPGGEPGAACQRVCVCVCFVAKIKRGGDAQGNGWGVGCVVVMVGDIDREEGTPRSDRGGARVAAGAGLPAKGTWCSLFRKRGEEAGRDVACASGTLPGRGSPQGGACSPVMLSR